LVLLKRQRYATALWGVGGMALVALFNYHFRLTSSDYLIQSRNFYGILGVRNSENRNGQLVRTLIDGEVIHGTQLMDPKYRRLPTGYYRIESGIGVSVKFLERSESLHMGVIGLGAGTSASYGSPGDTIRFYEINPETIDVANNYFYYLRDCEAESTVILGDARISLERELIDQGSQQFHILAVDAFSSDAIPVHLLTQEAFSLYWRHLRPDGILAFHVTNSHLDLSVVVRNLAKSSGKQAVLVKVLPDIFSDQGSEWILTTSNETFLNDDRMKEHITEWASDDIDTVLWTDDYSNLFSVLG